MDRICLIVVYASIVVLVLAVSLIGPPTDGRSKEFAVARVMRP
jgi:hypothetical protein